MTEDEVRERTEMLLNELLDLLRREIEDRPDRPELRAWLTEMLEASKRTE